MHRLWPYADALFARQRTLSSAVILTIAADVGIDQPRFTKCVESHQARARVLHDADAVRAGIVVGTPTFYVNGKRFEGALPLAELLRLVH